LLLGLAGNDVLDGGDGSDEMFGGDGRDSLEYSRRTARLVVVGLDGFKARLGI
jgi:Ca2+-binding RTX toxin-like protein